MVCTLWRCRSHLQVQQLVLSFQPRPRNLCFWGLGKRNLEWLNLGRPNVTNISSRKLASASWNPSCVIKVLAGAGIANRTKVHKLVNYPPGWLFTAVLPWLDHSWGHGHHIVPISIISSIRLTLHFVSPNSSHTSLSSHLPPSPFALPASFRPNCHPHIEIAILYHLGKVQLSSQVAVVWSQRRASRRQGRHLVTNGWAMLICETEGTRKQLSPVYQHFQTDHDKSRHIYWVYNLWHDGVSCQYLRTRHKICSSVSQQIGSGKDPEKPDANKCVGNWWGPGNSDDMDAVYV